MVFTENNHFFMCSASNQIFKIKIAQNMTRRSQILLFSLIFFAITGLYIFYPRFTLQIQKVLSDDYLKSMGNYSQNYSKNTALDQNYTQKNDTEAQFGFIFTYQDLEAQLCRQSTVDWPNKPRFQAETGPCPKTGIVSVVSGGRTGNQMWEYASVWAVARRTGLDPYIPACIRSTLDKIFEQLTIPTFKKIANCPVERNTFVESLAEWQSHLDQNIILPRYSALMTLVSPYMRDIGKEYRFTKKLRDKAQEVLRGFLKERALKQYTFVGVHVRRTDYIKYLKDKFKVDAATPQFFTNAMTYYRGKYPDCLFIYISDDLKWCSDHFGKLEDVVITSKNSLDVDLAIMAACNHTIFDYGTYGEWGSILAGGEAVTLVFRKNGKVDNFRENRLMTNWSRTSN